MLPDPNDRYVPHRRAGALRLVTIVIALVAVTAFAGMIGYTYMARDDGAPGTAPLIKADPRPMKTAPDKPGGMEVPHQDKEIYGKLVISNADVKRTFLKLVEERELPEIFLRRVKNFKIRGS